MSHQDKFTIVIRLLGLYFLWQAVQTFLTVLFIGSLLPKSTSNLSNLLDIFSGSQVNNTFQLQNIAMLLVNGLWAATFLTWAKNIAAWLTHDIRNTPTASSTNENDVITTTIKIIGLVLFVITIKDFVKSLPSILFLTENPFTSPILILFILQVLFSLLLILRTHAITKLMQKFSK